MIGRKQLFIAAALAAFTVTAQELTKNMLKITMPDGEVYRHPKVLSRNAEGITIMHDTGVAFWRFTDLPKAIRKEFHYNPKQAAEYRKEMTKRRIKLQEKLAVKKADFNFEQKVVALNLQRYYVHEMKFKIQDLERDLGQDKKDLPVAKSEARSDLNKVAEIAENQQSGNRYGGRNCGYGNCYSYRQGSNTMGFSAKGALDKDRKKQEQKVESLEFKRDWDEKSLPRLKDEYKHQKQHLAEMEAEMKIIKKQHSSKEFDEKVRKATDIGYAQLQTKLKQLKDLCDNKLITPDEYIKKKVKLLAAFK
jgi:hypothetical protein